RAPEDVRRVLVCSGKVYYELLEEREKRFGAGETGGVALVRLEQLYPFDADALRAALEPFAGADHFTWVQEEPRNMGAWSFVRERIEELLPGGRRLGYAGRAAYAAPAGGSMRIHRRRQAALIAQAFGD